MDEPLYSVGELAAELDATPRALRFYEDRGLLRPRRIGQNRVYSRRDRARLTLILRGKRLGFSLTEIGEWLALYDADPLQIEQTRHLAQRVEIRLARLERQRDDLEATIGELRQIRGEIATHLASVDPADNGAAMDRLQLRADGPRPTNRREIAPASADRERPEAQARE